MLPSWFSQTVRRIRPGTKMSRGSEIPDWDNATEATISGCSVQPSTTELMQDGRVLGLEESFNLYMPYDADVLKGDRVMYGENTYVVSGIPRPWVSPTGALSNKQVTLERWSG